MLVVLLCCMMKLVEFSTGKPAMTQRPRGKYRRKHVRRRGKGMAEVGVGIRGSPDSDCNSNHPGSTSYLSNTSSQDIDFVQDNSDYQWFLDYNYRDGGTNHHTSILSLPESYEAGDLNYYDALAKNMDANLAEADMESFRTEDIHALLTNLPPMCTDHLSQENNRQGECFASVSGSMMAKFDLDSSISPHSSSQDSANSTSMSICKSELLFSPVKETPMPGANFSVDSLDCDMMLTCQANKDNYTIAFEGSGIIYSEDSDYNDDKNTHCTSGSAHWPVGAKALPKNLKLDSSMTQSDSGSFTTWSKLKKRSSDNHIRRHPSGNNNNSEDDASRLGLTENSTKSQSMPNLYKQKLRSLIASGYLKSQSNSSSDTNTVKRRPVKIFDIQHQVNTTSGSLSDMATSVDASSSDNSAHKQQQHNFSLVKLYMKQKSISTEGMSTTMDQLSSSENWPCSQSESNSSDSKLQELKHSDASDIKMNELSSRTYDLIAEEAEEDDSVERSDSLEKEKVNINKPQMVKTKISSPQKLSDKNDLMNKSIQTQFSEMASLKNANKTVSSPKPAVKVVEPSFLNKLKQEGEMQKPVYVLYPNYVLPNLDFLNEKNDEISKVLLVPQRAPKLASSKSRPFSCNDLESLKKKGFQHIQDWESLNFLLPQEYRKILADVPEISNYIKTNLREKPSFMYNKNRRRPVSCDLNQNTSSSSSTATQPSSGYRGSSSILTDSQNSPAPQINLKPLFVYHYDSVTSSEASLMSSERNNTVTTTAPPLPVRCVSLPQEPVPPRPPLPKSILRKGLEKVDSSKRYSMYETSEEELIEDSSYKRKSYPEAYLRNKRLSETEDEGVDAGTSSSSLDEHHEPTLHKDFLLSHISNDELAQLEEFLKISGISSENEEHTEESLLQLRSYVSKFLSLKINQEGAEHFGGKKSVSFAEKVNVLPKYLDTKHFIPPNNSPNVSAFIQNKNYSVKNLTDTIISEENETGSNYCSPHSTPVHGSKQNMDYNLVQKKALISAVTEAVEQIMKYFSPASNQIELNALGDSSLNPACAKLILHSLCPALYAVLSDGLKASLDTSFGPISNSVWQVVESSAQQGPLTKALNELVMRINGEDLITEGVVKFNAFVFGLLNVRSLDAWASYLKTRESVLRKHYTADSLMLLSHTGSASVRSLLEAMITSLQPLAFLPLQLDLLFEYRQLHLSFKRMDSYQQPLSPHKHSPSPNFKQFTSKISNSRSTSESEEISAATVRNCEAALPDLLNSSGNNHKWQKERPRSCVDPGLLSSKPNFKLGEDVTSIAKKRWSGIALTSKLYQAYDRLSKEDEEYTDSLENNECKNVQEENKVEEPESLDSNIDEKPIIGRRFKKLQQKWEMLSGKESDSPPTSPTHSGKSKIPRLIPSPVKASGIPVPVKKVTTPPGGIIKTIGNLKNTKNPPVKKAGSSVRTSRVDQLEEQGTPRHLPRPSSLPYKVIPQKASKVTPPRRAASSSLNRKPATRMTTPKVVRTLTHKLPSESGHLSYNEGERLNVVLEVDENWLLCCRGTQKGLVSKSAVIADSGRF